MVDDLPTGYYHDNFTYLIDFVREHYDDVLSPTEKTFHEQFSKSSLAAQRLYVRLISRKGPYLRTDKLKYEEIQDLPRALENLVALGFVARNSEAGADIWLKLATKNELTSFFDVSHKSAKKDQLCLEIAATTPVEEIQKHLPFDLVEPLYKDVLAVYRLLFFGNLYQDLTDFVLRDLGITPFESYSLDPSGRYFDRRELIEDMLCAYQLQDEAYEAMASTDVNLAEFARTYLLGLVASDPLLAKRYSKILNRVARQLEREAAPELALALYDGSGLTPARERRARLLASQGEPDTALQLCRDILDTPTTEDEYEFAVGFANRLARQHQLDSAGIPAKHADGYQVVSLTLPYVPGQRVELTVADWLAEHATCAATQTVGGSVWYVENGLLPGLFGLYFWDLIFYPVSGAFFNPFQRGPADLFSTEFYEQRSVLIESRFEEMSDPDAMRQRMFDTFAEKFGKANHFVMWRMLSKDLLDLALKRIPVAHLEATFRRLLRDLKHNRSGLPDLICFPIESGYEMVEVKGPGDTLQANQKRWLRFFHDQQIPAQVVNVTWQA